MPVKVQVIYSVRPDAMPALVQAAVSLALQDALLHWHEEDRPRHFTNEGRKRYGYQPRKGDNEPPTVEKIFTRPDGSTYTKQIANPSYSWRKRRVLRHNLPNVWSGLSAKLSEQVRIDAGGPGSRGRAKLAFTGLPKYFYQYLKAGTYQRRLRDGRVKPFTLTHDQPKKFEELVIVTAEEQEAMARVTDQNITRHLATMSAPATVAI